MIAKKITYVWKMKDKIKNIKGEMPFLKNLNNFPIIYCIPIIEIERESKIGIAYKAYLKILLGNYI